MLSVQTGFAVLLSMVALILALGKGGRLRDDLYDAVFVANVDGVSSILADMRDGILRAGHAHIDVNRLDSEHQRNALMMCGMSDSEGAKDYTIKADDACRQIAIMLLEAGVDAHHKDKHNWTALHHGAVRGFALYCNILISKGKVSINDQDNEGLTPLMRAAGGGWLETVRALIAAGSDHRIKDLHGKSALHLVVQMAVIQESYVPYLRKVLKILPPDSLELEDEHGRTPLHYAIIGKGSFAVAQVLLDAGSESNKKDGFGITPYQMASAENIRLLLAEANVRAEEKAIKTWKENNKKQKALEL